MKKYADGDSLDCIHVIKWESIILRTQHDGFVRYAYSYVNTDFKKRLFNSDGRWCSRHAAWWSDISGLPLQDERPRRSQGREKPAVVSQRWKMRGKQSGTDNEKGARKAPHINIIAWKRGERRVYLKAQQLEPLLLLHNSAELKDRIHRNTLLSFFNSHIILPHRRAYI